MTLETPRLYTLDIVAYEATLELMLDLRKHHRLHAIDAVLMRALVVPPPRMSDALIRRSLGQRPHRRGTHRMAGSVPLVTLKLAMYRPHMDAWSTYLDATSLYGSAGSRFHDATHALDKLVCRAWIAAALPHLGRKRPYRPARARPMTKVA